MPRRFAISSSAVGVHGVILALVGAIGAVREQRRRRWGAPRAMLLAAAPLARAAGATFETRNCERRDGRLMARTRQGGRRVRNGPRRACAGWMVKRHFGHSRSRA